MLLISTVAVFLVLKFSGVAGFYCYYISAVAVFSAAVFSATVFYLPLV